MTDANKLIAVYVKIRDMRATIKREYEERDAKLKEDVEKLEHRLLNIIKDTGVDSLKSTSGTATRMVQERYWAPDWDQMKEFVKEHDAIDLLEKRVAQGNLKQFMEENPDLTPPVQKDSKYVIRVTRGKK